MRKYTRPEMVCKAFGRESVLTASGAQTGESSMAKLKNELTANYGVSADSIIEASWN